MPAFRKQKGPKSIWSWAGVDITPPWWGGNGFRLPPQGLPHGGVIIITPPGSAPWGGNKTSKIFAPAARY